MSVPAPWTRAAAIGVYLGYAIVFTQNPFDHSWHSFFEALTVDGGKFAFAVPDSPRRMIMFLGNVLMTTPLGAVVAWTTPFGCRWRTVLFAAALSLLASALLEGLQMFSYSRASEAGDLVANTAGGALGAGAAFWLMKRRALIRMLICRFGKWLLPVAACLYSATLVSAFWTRSEAAELDPWNDSFLFGVSEESLHGDVRRRVIRRVRVFDAPIEMDSSVHGKGPVVVDRQPILLYRIDASAGEFLQIAGEGSVGLHRLESHGTLSVVSERPMMELARRLRETDGFTVDIWLVPERRTGSAIWLAGRGTNCNFRFEQVGQDLEVRIRTRATGLAAEGNVLRTSSEPLGPGPVRILITYGSGVVRLWVGGEPISRLALATPTLRSLHSAGIGGRLSYGWLFGLPTGVLLGVYVWVKRSASTLVAMSVLVAFGVWNYGEAFFPWDSAQDLGVALIWLALGLGFTRQAIRSCRETSQEP